MDLRHHLLLHELVCVRRGRDGRCAEVALVDDPLVGALLPLGEELAAAPRARLHVHRHVVERLVQLLIVVADFEMAFLNLCDEPTQQIVI